MNRRDALKNLGLGAGYALATPAIFSLLQSCKSEPVFTPEFVNQGQGHALRRIVDLIIPSDEAVMGANELGVHQFIDSFWKNILKPEDQARIKLGFTALENKFKSTFNKEIADGKAEDFDQLLSKYLKTTKEEQQTYYNKLGDFSQVYAKDKTAVPDVDAASFSLLSQIRGMTIWGWKTTEEIGENVLAYDPIPGQQKGCISVEEATGGKAYSI
jgi:hypothetical protein